MFSVMKWFVIRTPVVSRGSGKRASRELSYRITVVYSCKTFTPKLQKNNLIICDQHFISFVDTFIQEMVKLAQKCVVAQHRVSKLH